MRKYSLMYVSFVPQLQIMKNTMQQKTETNATLEG